MARKAYGLHATQVNLSNYPDDGTSPVGSAEWNQDLDNEGMLGFSKQNATTAISGGALLITDTVCVATGEGGNADDLDSITLTNTSEYDIVYLFGQAGYDITLKHGGQNGSLNVNGEVSTVSGSDEVLSATKPTILIRVGNYWYGYGGGSASNLTTSSLAAATLVIESEGISGSDNDTTLPTSAAVKDYVDTQITAEDLDATTDSGTIDIDLNSETLSVVGGEGVDTSATGTTITVAGEDATSSNKGIASFASGEFTLTSGAVAINAIAEAKVTGLTTALGLKAPLAAPALTGAATAVDIALSGRLKTDKGADVASATAMTLGADGNTFDITGTTTIVTIPSTNWAVGNIIHLQFDGVLTVTHSSATDSILLGDQGNMTTAAGDVLSLFFNGTNWVEISRSVVGSAGVGGNTTAHIVFGGVHSIHNLQTLFLEHQSENFDDSSNDRTDESQLFVKYEDTNNDGLYVRLKINGSTQNVKIA